MTFKITPQWDEVAPGFKATVPGFSELGEIVGGPTREDFELEAAAFMDALNPPQEDFVVEWPGRTVGVHVPHLKAA
jgi:hypothetical protein